MRIVERPIVAHLDDAVLHAVRQGFDILRKRNDGAVAFLIEVVLDAPARHRLTVDIEDAVFHLDVIAGEADDTLDVVGRIVSRQFEDNDITALRRMKENPSGKYRQSQRQRVTAVSIRKF